MSDGYWTLLAVLQELDSGKRLFVGPRSKAALEERLATAPPKDPAEAELTRKILDHPNFVVSQPL